MVTGLVGGDVARVEGMGGDPGVPVDRDDGVADIMEFVLPTAFRNSMQERGNKRSCRTRMTARKETAMGSPSHDVTQRDASRHT